LFLIAGAALFAGSYFTKPGDAPVLNTPGLLHALGLGFFILGTLSSAAFATILAWLHQAAVKRITFALFRLYATAVSAGIGGVFGCSLGWWAQSAGLPYYPLWWIPSMLILITAFGAAAYRGASALRGKAPTRFTWITPEEYAGT
jgi:hypothetical protein